MTDTINSVVAFRCPAAMKQRMKLLSEANGQCLSSFIRSACAYSLRDKYSFQESFAPSAEPNDSGDKE